MADPSRPTAASARVSALAPAISDRSISAASMRALFRASMPVFPTPGAGVTAAAGMEEAAAAAAEPIAAKEAQLPVLVRLICRQALLSTVPAIVVAGGRQ